MFDAVSKRLPDLWIGPDFKRNDVGQGWILPLSLEHPCPMEFVEKDRDGMAEVCNRITFPGWKGGQHITSFQVIMREALSFLAKHERNVPFAPSIRLARSHGYMKWRNTVFLPSSRLPDVPTTKVASDTASSSVL